MGGKECFGTRTAAERATYRLKRRYRHKDLPAVYYCEYCQSYHITSMSYSRSKDLQTYKRRPKHPELYEL